MQHDKRHYMVFIGSYADPAEPGIYAYSLDSASGRLTLLNSFGGYKNPCFLDVDHANRRIYAVAEAESADGGGALALAFSFDPESGGLSLLGEQKSVGRATCHIHYDPDRGMVMATSYSDGVVGLLPVNADGTLGPLADMHYHQGASVHPARQDRPHPHAAYAFGGKVYVPDLGIDRIVSYRPDRERMKLVPDREYALAPGAGPRHMAFHPKLPCAYVINELDNTVTVLRLHPDSGSLEPVQTLSTLPPSYEGESSCAEILVSPDGRYLYGSNRGHDSIAVFRTDEASGRLSLVEIRPSLGARPRNFALSPDGKYIVAAHQDTGNLVVLAIDPDTGKLSDTGHRAEAPKGVCVRFWSRPIDA